MMINDNFTDFINFKGCYENVWIRISLGIIWNSCRLISNPQI